MSDAQAAVGPALGDLARNREEHERVTTARVEREKSLASSIERFLHRFDSRCEAFVEEARILERLEQRTRRLGQLAESALEAFEDLVRVFVFDGERGPSVVCDL